MKIITKDILSGVLLITLGVIISVGMVSSKGNLLASVNPMNLQASDVPYTNNSQSTVQGAIDNLYTKASTLNNIQNVLNEFIDTTTLRKNTAGTVFASSKGVCIKRNNTVHCFAPNNYNYEKEHLQQVFCDISCYVRSSYVSCQPSDFNCYVYSTGDVNCEAKSDGSFCNVDSDGSVICN